MSDVIDIRQNAHQQGREFIQIAVESYLATTLLPLRYIDNLRIPMPLCDVTRAIFVRGLLSIGGELVSLQRLKDTKEPNEIEKDILFGLGCCKRNLDNIDTFLHEVTTTYLVKDLGTRSFTFSPNKVIVDFHRFDESVFRKVLIEVFELIKVSDEETNHAIQSTLCYYDDKSPYNQHASILLKKWLEELEGVRSQLT